LKIAYLIVAHRGFAQLARLVARLAHADAAFYVHLDRKVPDREVKSVVAALARYAPVFVEPRVDVVWGGHSQVRATLAGLEAALRSGRRFDYLHLLSGQDYPLLGAAPMRRRLEALGGRECIDFCELAPHGWKDAMYRYERYHLHDRLRSPAACEVAEALVNAVMPRRAPPRGYTMYAGSSWWTITEACAHHVVETARREIALYDFFRSTECPDEMFFQTLVLNSRFAAAVVNDNLRYVDWSAGGRNPKILTTEDLPKLAASGKLFARKFDAAVDEGVMDALDAHAAGAAVCER
jgi:hypothetical protein